MKPSGAHTHPEMGGGGIGTGVLVFLGAIVIAAVAGPVIRAVTDLIEVLAITVAVLAGVALVAVAALVAYRVRRARRRSPLMVHRITPGAQRPAEPLPAPPRPAIEAPREVHLHFYGTAPEDVAAIIAQHGQAMLAPTTEEETPPCDPRER